MARFIYFFIVIFLLFIKNSFSIPPMDGLEYLERCRKFTVPLSSLIDYKDIPPALTECGVDLGKVMVINTESILKSVFSDKTDRISYFHGLIDSKEKLSKAFKTFLYSTPTILEDEETEEDCLKRSETYRQFVFEAISNGFESRKYRERIVSFLAALEYRKSINPKFTIYLSRSEKFEERDCGDYLILGLELKDGRHYSDYVSKTHCNFTLPYLLAKETPIYSNGLAAITSISDDTYVYSHEIGHAIHDLLGITARGIPFSLMADNIFMRNTFFPLMCRAENLMPLLISEIKLSIDRKIESRECSDALDYFTKRLEMVKAPYKKDRLPSDAEEFDRMGITEIEKMLGTESIQQVLKEKSISVNDNFLERFVMLGIKYLVFYDSWTTPEELFQIEGAVATNSYIIIDTNSDLDLFKDLSLPIRWLHACGDTAKMSPETPTIDCAPEKKYIEALFYLHGLKI